MALSAGELRHRITIQQCEQIQDPQTGEVVPTWVNLHERVPAKVTPLSVREFIASRSEQSEITARIVIRHRAGLDATMRILYRGKIYNPAGFLPDEDSGLEYLTIPCTEGTNAG